MNFQTNIKAFVVSMIGRWLNRGWKEGWVRFDEPVQNGWPDELRMLFRSLSLAMLPRNEALENVVDDWADIEFSQFWGNIVELGIQNDPVARRWENLDATLSLAPEEIALIAMLVAIHQDWAILRALRFAMSEATPGQPRWGFVTRFIQDALQVADAETTLNPNNSVLFKSGIVRFKYTSDSSMSAAEIEIPPQISDYLYNPKCDHKTHLNSLTSRALVEPVSSQVKRITRKANMHVVIEGATGSGKTRIAQALAGKLKCGGITLVDLTPDTSVEDARKHITDAIALAVLKNDAIVMQHVTQWCDRWNDGILHLVERLNDVATPVIWLVTGDKPAFIHNAPECHIRVAMPNRVQREAIWSELVGKQLNEKWISQLAGQFLLTRGQIEDAYALARAANCDSEEALYKSIAAEARILSREGLGSLAVPEPARVSMEQLIVSKECGTALQDLLMYAKHRRELAKDWGFERSMPYGLGLAALFCGPPGTGKTYGAQVIATELELELYRVDLSQLVSKYIGETEKHLAELFNAAEQGEILLLFDEADSVFGKRTEVKTSVDRYANLEINYLLQRLERFSGVSILTSNFESGIDEAFMRRIRFKVPFELPEERSRAILWNKFLSPAIPRSRDVDIDTLAELFELSGGHIKEAVLRAASIAYGSKDKCVTQDLLMSSAELEYKKLGKLLPYHDEFDEDRSHWN